MTRTAEGRGEMDGQRKGRQSLLETAISQSQSLLLMLAKKLLQKRLCTQQHCEIIWQKSKLNINMLKKVKHLSMYACSLFWLCRQYVIA